MLQVQASNGTHESENKQKSKIFSFSATLNSLGTIDRLPEFRFRWNSNEEVFIILTSLEEHKNWLANEVNIRPPNGSLLLYNRNNSKTRSYHLDKYFWKTRKNSKSSARVDHSSLRIRGIECIYCSYVHSALVSTFHRRCYWLLENPDIVLVHYLNIPDRTTTFDDLVTSLLPYKTLTEQELLCQLQPILSGNKEEGHQSKIVPVDVKKLVSEVKGYKEPKTKGRANKKRASGSNKPSASSTQRKPSEINGNGPNSVDKCTNCNKCYTTCPTTSISSRTNVAVTINRNSGSTLRPKIADEPVTCFVQKRSTESDGECLVSASKIVQNGAQQSFPAASHCTRTQGIATTDLISGHDRANQLYPGQGLLQQNPYAIASSTPNNTLSNGCHGYATLPVTSQALLENDLVVLDYDGMNLVHSQSENDLSKTFDIGLFDNDLLHYLPEYLPNMNDLPSELQTNGSSDILSTSLSPLTAGELQKATVQSNYSEQTTPCTSNQVGLSSCPEYGNFVHQSITSSGGIPTRMGRTLSSPTEMISTDCHTLDNLTPSLLYAKASIDDLLPGGHHCPSRNQTLRGQVLQIGVPDESLVETGVSHMSCPEVDRTLFHEGITQMSLPEFDVSQSAANSVSVCGTNGEVSSLKSVPQDGMFQSNESMAGISQNEVSNESLFSAETNGGFQNVGLCPMSESAAGATSMFGVQKKDTFLSGSRVSSSDGRMEGGLSQPSDTLTQSNPQTTSHISENIITEFSPEWSYCDGKTKILILGDWSRQNGSYSSLFDGCSVAATLIQPGVLRCFCPPHDPGLVSLQIAWNGFIISNACVFEYKTRENATNSVSDWLSPRDEDLKKLILERIERLESVLGIAQSFGNNEAERRTVEGEGEVGTFEDRIVRICEVLLERICLSTIPETGPKGLTLLHLAAGLGLTKLVRLLKKHACMEKLQTMRTGGEGAEDATQMTKVSKPEWSPHAKDSFGCTPLMWACYRGHHDAAMTLLAWQPSSYRECDQSGRSAKALAQEMGHVSLVREMDEFICGEDMYSMVMESSPQSPSSSCAYLSVSSNEQAPQSPMSADSLAWERVDGVTEPPPDFDTAVVMSEDRPNTLGKVLVEIRALIQQAEERARSPLQTPSNSAPFALNFTGFSDIQTDDRPSDNLMKSEPEFGPRTPHYDTLSIDSSPICTPASHSPSSPAVRNSPQSAGTDTSEFEEFLSKPRQFLERDFSELTLTDIEQQELLQAARIIQNAYRQFKIRKKQHFDELKAAVLIQSYYRRYKQFALYRRITKAAVLIQNSYRAHKEHEQFKRSRHAAAVIQTYFRHYRKRKQRNAEEDAPGKRLETKYRKPSYGR
ncbi:calmodulin-binding transcription activator 2-like [Dendronephthya gigantea]|uniref:calmodulin-binding transcription activator 2-like n=1 Tax=Dendronephthya gigantea TaxID=151771 RepID=UPI00106A7AB4|nr:calmodulin-binding transcription activator 2-like [Dendronephthya gigantea]